MDFLKKVGSETLKAATQPQGQQQQQQQPQQQQSSGASGLLGTLDGATSYQQQPQQPQQQQQSSGLLGTLSSVVGQATGSQQQSSQQQSTGSNALVDKLHGVIGGGPESEKKEDVLDKAIDLVQEHVFKAGPQDNESAKEQAMDDFIADNIRTGFKKATGKEFPIEKKEEKPSAGLGALAGSLFK
ncbi:hypothetical protein QBC35DRAFT_381901 [Podospora australis]|uniref:Uncharacterized protein n=1 Tax=Podospora australis TaxID=1536484 RepID=A0AAN6WWD8_9PEZI|nr:hypothetical protein QBC35DRAFT_381901 [Podospora australis]